MCIRDRNERGDFFSSANSINWGRVLPQVVYYVSSYADLLKAGAIQEGDSINICVPTGNFGNMLSADYAKRMGVPVNKRICASNSNNVLTDFLRTGAYDRNRPFYTTVSPSMDILISSNLERLLYAFSGEDDKLVSDYMTQLNASGRYEVNDAIKAPVSYTHLDVYKRQGWYCRRHHCKRRRTGDHHQTHHSGHG